MREDISTDSRIKPSKHSDQNQVVKGSSKANGNPLKPRTWGSHIVKGFTTDKKSKVQSVIPANKKPPTALEIPNQKNQNVSQQSRVKRSLMGDLSCSANTAQVHPHMFDCQRVRSPASHNLYLELDHLRTLLRESKEREQTLQSEVLRYKDNPRVKELEKELDNKRKEVENLVYKLGELEAEKTTLCEQLSFSHSSEQPEEALIKNGEDSALPNHSVVRKKSFPKNSDMEIHELRRLNKELQLQKRNLALRLSSAESQMASLKKIAESDVVAKAEAEALVLRHTNENLSKQVEGLQMSRLNEVEELAYLRWINSCLRQELLNSDNQSHLFSSVDVNEISLHAIPNVYRNNSTKFPALRGPSFSATKSSLVDIDNLKKVGSEKKNTTRWPKIDEDCQILECDDILDKDWVEAVEGRSPMRRHSISGPKGIGDEFKVNKRRQSDGFLCSKDSENDAAVDQNYPAIKSRLQIIAQKYELGASPSPTFSVARTETVRASILDVEKRALRIPNPPPRPSCFVPVTGKKEGTPTFPPPPPPPPPKFSTRNNSVMQRAPQVVELYHSLMKRDSRKDSANGGVCEASDVANVRSSMIGEIENRSYHLLAIKADIETQGEFVRSLIKEVNGAVYRDIEDVVAFVKWLDDELSFLVDERAVLKHFDWPEKKADTLREAAFGYGDLKKLETEVTCYKDDPRLPCDIALKKMAGLAEKMERTVYNLLRTRDGLVRHCREFQIPTDWMLDNGIISKIKFASVKMAKKYMKRVALELQAMEASDKDPALEYMLLQGVRFAFRIHQFAGGFDGETMQAFEELRNLAHVRNKS